MKKRIFLLIIILVMLTGCKDKNVTVSPAPTATATTTPTEQPTNTPTATSTPTNTPTPTNIPTETPVPTPEPTVSTEAMNVLKAFIGTDTHGDMVAKIAECKAEAKFFFDTESTEPWGIITSVENISENLVTVMISDGYKYVNSLWKEGMTVDELGKLVKSGKCFEFHADYDSKKPDGTILSIEKSDVLDYYSSTIIVTVAGENWEAISAYSLDSETEKDGTVTRHYSDPYGISELTEEISRKEYYNDKKELVTYSISNYRYGGILESLEKLGSAYLNPFDLYGIISDHGRQTNVYEETVYHADDTIHAEYQKNRSMAIGWASTDNWDLTIYDENGKNPVNYSGGVAYGNDVEIRTDEYGRYFIID